MLVDMIGDRLKELRTGAGMTQPAFAAIVGTSKQYVSQLESGKNQIPNGEFIEGWARHFKVNMRWLASGTGPKHAESSTGEGSHLMRLDPERIAELATVLAERWKDVPGGFDLRNEAHAAHFVLCYGLFINMKDRPVPENTVAFSAALTSPQGATGDERSENVPTTGTVRRKTGKSGKR
jgi:transcriptional regulator with XRE-family HTH domain